MKKYILLITSLSIAMLANATDYLTIGKMKIDVDNISTIKYNKAENTNEFSFATVTFKNGDTQNIDLAQAAVNGIEFTTPHITWAVLQFIAGEGTINRGSYLDAGAQVFVDGVTNAEDVSLDASGIEAQLGFSANSTDPTSDTSWSWSEITFSGDWGDNFYFQGRTDEIINETGTYNYAIRFRMGEFDNWFYASKDESNYSTFNVVTPTEVTWTTIGSWNTLNNGTIELNAKFETLAEVFVDGITNADVPMENADLIVCEIGVSKTSSNPIDTESWVWVPTYFKWDGGNNIVFQGGTEIKEEGTWYYAIRAKYGDEGKWCYGGTNGTYDGKNSVCGSFTVGYAGGGDIPSEQYQVTWTTIGNWNSLWSDKDVQYFESTFEVFANGLTDQGKTDRLQVQMGWCANNSDPSSAEDWQWSDCWAQWQNGNNYVFQGRATLTEKGTYYYAVRARYGENCEWCYGGTSGIWDGSNSTNGTFTWK